MQIEGAKLEGPLHFYDGEVILWFDREEWEYSRQESNGELVPVDGVTTPIHIIDKSSALTPWAARVTVEKAARLFQAALKAEPERGTLLAFEYDEILQSARTAHRDKLEDAGAVGHDAHLIIESLIEYSLKHNNGIVQIASYWMDWDCAKDKDPRVLNCVNAALCWMHKHNVVWLKTERKIYSRTFNYAGTMDGLCLVDGVISVADWKTSNGLYTEYCYQTAAYMHAYQEETGEHIADRWILRLGKEDAEFDPWHLPGREMFKQDFTAFLLCQELFNHHKLVEARMSEMKKARTKARRLAKKMLDSTSTVQ